MVDVVDEADRDPALLRREERGQHEGAGVGLEADVVDRDVEALLRAAEKRGELARDLGRCLAAVAQRPQLDWHRAQAVCCWAARYAALRARLAA